MNFDILNIFGIFLQLRIEIVVYCRGNGIVFSYLNMNTFNIPFKQKTYRRNLYKQRYHNLYNPPYTLKNETKSKEI